jgi:MoxR-like ATPase
LVFNPKEGNFYFKPGPVFSNIVLIDEINRAPAKTQSALFEVMEEKQITIDGHTYFMQKPFLVIATQNPIEQEGTYRLPEAQLDRFIFKVEVDYPTAQDEINILTHQQGKPQTELLSKVNPVLNADEILTFRQSIEAVQVEPKLIEFIVKIVADTRNNPSLYLGGSTRASLAILKSAKTTAALKGRHFVIPEDIVEIAPAVLRHRIMLTPEKEMEGLSPDELIENIVKSLEIPR